MSTADARSSDEEEDCGTAAAYGIEDMLGALTDSADEYEDTVESQTAAGKCHVLKYSFLHTNYFNFFDKIALDLRFVHTVDANGSDKTALKQVTATDQTVIIQDNAASKQNAEADSKSIEKTDSAAKTELSSSSGDSLTRNTSPTNSPSKFKISSDIGGRFHVEGAKYDENDPPPLPSSAPPGDVAAASADASATAAANVSPDYENVESKTESTGTGTSLSFLIACLLFAHAL